MQPDICSHKYVEELEIGVCCLSCGLLRSFVSETPSAISTPRIAFSDVEYEYAHLKPELDEIRLVTIHSGRESDPIQCSVMTVELDSATEYAAVSYTWATEDGNASKSRSILIRDGASIKTSRYLKVTANCEDALRQLRPLYKDYVVWIDSISIHQNRISERNQQVRMMDRIYKHASCVDICIQAPDQDFHDVLSLFAHDTAILDYPWGAKTRDLEAEPNYIQLKRLFDLRYFSRAWVIQEVLLARKAILHVNGAAVPFEEKALKYIKGAASLHSKPLPQITRWLSAWKQRPSIISCLNMSLNSSASEPRDQIYAITGLLRPQIRAMIPVDYMLSLEQVLTAAVTACIVECGDLRILDHTQLPNGADRLTTPAFSLRHFKSFLDREASKMDSNNASLDTNLERDYYKLWHDQPSVGVLRNGTWVHMLVDFANDTSGGHQKTSGQAELSYPPSQILPRLKLFARPIATCIAPLDQSIAALSEHLANGNNPLPDWIWTRLNDSIKVDTSHTKSIRTKEHYKAAGRRLQEITMHFPFSQELSMFETHNSAGTTSGHFIPGDVVFVIDGALDAFLLREVGVDVYRVVGQCCLLGTRAFSFEYRGLGAEIDLEGLDGTRRIIEIY